MKKNVTSTADVIKTSSKVKEFNMKIYVMNIEPKIVQNILKFIYNVGPRKKLWFLFVFQNVWVILNFDFTQSSSSSVVNNLL